MRPILVGITVVVLASRVAAQAPEKPLTREERLKWAKSLELSKDLKKAAEVLAALHKDFPQDAQALEDLAGIRVQLKDFKAAAQDYEGLAALQPAERKWQIMAAKTLLWSGDHKGARGKAIQLLEKTPTDAELVRLQADASFYLKRYAEAGELYAKLLAAAPGDPLLRRQAAQAFLWSERPADAEAHYRWLIEQGKADAVLRQEFGQALNALQKFDEAAAVFQGLLAGGEESPAALRGLLDAQMGMKDFPGAIIASEKLLALAPGDGELREKLADLLMWADEPKKALPHLERLVAEDPENDARRRKLGNCYMAAHEFGKAVEQFQRICEKHPGDAEAEGALAMALYLNKQFDEATARLRAALERAPNDLKTIRLLAEIAMEQEHFDEAIALFRRAIDVGDTDRDTLLRYARVLSWNKNYNEALAAYDRLTQQHGQDWRIEREKARMLGWDRRYSAALGLYAHIADEYPENEPVQAEMAAKCAFYDERDERAISEYNRLISLEPESLEGRFDLGQVYSRQSMWPEAERAYRDVLDIYPGHYRARDALDKVQAISTATGISPQYTYHHRRSSERLTDYKENAYGVAADHWLTPRLRAGVDYEYENLGFIGYHDVPANVYQLSLDYYSHPALDAGIAFGAREYSNTAQDHWNYEADIGLRLFDVARVTAVARRADFIENLTTLLDGVERDDYGVGLELRPTRRAFLEADYLYSDFTDTNEKHTLRAEARYRLLWEPTRLDIGHRFEHWNFRRDLGTYFAPHGFQMYTAYVDWRHYLNKHELFWGTKDTYYNLGYAFGWDSQGETTHTFRTGVHHDFSHRFSLDLDYLLTRGSVYDEDYIMATFTLRFGGKTPGAKP
ncbi:MAG: tetratricopeptide repeat protein [Planctomycetota bacterium]